MKTINLHSSIEELKAIESVNNLLTKGDIVVLDIEDTKNPEYKTVYMVQKIKGINSSSNVNAAQAFALGFNNSDRYERCIQNFKTEIANSLSIGDGLNETFGTNFAIQIVDTTEKDVNRPNQKPRQTVDGEHIVDVETGKPIYRNTILTTTDACEHKTKKGTLESKYKNAKTTVTKVIEAQA